MGQHVYPSRCVWEDNEAIGSVDPAQQIQRPSQVNNANFGTLGPGENIHLRNRAYNGGIVNNGSAATTEGLAAMTNWWSEARKMQVPSKNFFGKKG